MDILWSGAVLVPVITLCATMPPKELDPRGIAGWIALAALVHRYSGSSETALDQDLRACRAPDPLRSLLSNLRQHRADLEARPEDFEGALVDRSGLLAMYFACRQRGILDFYTGGKVLLQDSIDRHHILPRAQFPEKLRPKSDCVANVAFISGGVNKSIGLTGPEVYLRRINGRILASQCIPVDRELWAVDNAEGFWAARRQLLAEAFNDYVHRALPHRRL